RTHVVIAALESRARLTDQGSKNGSFLDGHRFTSIEAMVGSTLRMGRTELKLMPADLGRLALPPSEKDRFGGLYGRSLIMRQTFTLLEKAGAGEADVLIVGETGTGKELCAEAIHSNSARRAGPFVVC